MSTARLLIGDVFDRMAEIPDGSIDLVLTSPPFLALRSYLPADHPDKGKEIGSEPTPAEFLDTLLALTVEWRRVLAPHGSICVELGDTYSGSGGGGGDYLPGGMRAGQAQFAGSASSMRESNAAHWRQKNAWKGGLAGGGRAVRAADVEAGLVQDRARPFSPEARDNMPGWPMAKSLCGIPHLYHLSLTYGRNVLRSPPSAAELLHFFALIEPNLGTELTGSELLEMMRSWLVQKTDYGPTVEIEPWRVRNVIAWCRPNPPVGALGDKVRPATSYMTIATAARDRYFDLDAIRVPNERTDELVSSGHRRTERLVPNGGSGRCEPRDAGPGKMLANNPNGAPPLDHWWYDEDRFDQDAWLVSTQPYAGSHYATWPTALLTKPIRSMVPQRVCTMCGEPSRRITGAFTLDAYRSSKRPQTIKAVALADEHGLTDEHIAAVRAFGTSDAGKATVLNDGAGHNSDEVKRLAGEAKAVLGGYFREFVMSTEADRSSSWTDCGHDTWRTGVVLDPFAGSGTTLAVATGEGREAIGIDIDSRNADLVRERVGMFLDVELPPAAVPA